MEYGILMSSPISFFVFLIFSVSLCEFFFYRIPPHLLCGSVLKTYTRPV